MVSIIIKSQKILMTYVHSIAHLVYKFLRMPFDLSVVPETFKKYSESAFVDIPGVITTLNN